MNVEALFQIAKEPGVSTSEALGSSIKNGEKESKEFCKLHAAIFFKFIATYLSITQLDLGTDYGDAYTSWTLF